MLVACGIMFDFIDILKISPSPSLKKRGADTLDAMTLSGKQREFFVVCGWYILAKLRYI